MSGKLGPVLFTKTVLGDGRRMSLSVSNLGARLLYPDATDAIQKPVLWQKEAVLTMDVYGMSSMVRRTGGLVYAASNLLEFSRFAVSVGGRR